MSLSCEFAIVDAYPIWKTLGISEKEYYTKYPPVDISGNILYKEKEKNPKNKTDE